MKRFALMGVIFLASCGGAPVDPNRRAQTQRDAQAAYVAGNYSRAEELYAVLDDTHSRFLVAICKMKLDKPHEAIVVLHGLLTATSDKTVTAQIHLALSDAHAMQGEDDAAFREIMMVEAMPAWARNSVVKTDELKYRLGVASMRAGRFSAGRDYFHDLERLCPNSVHAKEAAWRRDLSGFGVLIGEFPSEADAKAAAVKVGSEKTRMVAFRGAYALVAGEGRPREEVQRIAGTLAQQGLSTRLLP